MEKTGTQADFSKHRLMHDNGTRGDIMHAARSSNCWSVFLFFFFYLFSSLYHSNSGVGTAVASHCSVPMRPTWVSELWVLFIVGGSAESHTAMRWVTSWSWWWRQPPMSSRNHANMLLLYSHFIWRLLSFKPPSPKNWNDCYYTRQHWKASLTRARPRRKALSCNDERTSRMPVITANKYIIISSLSCSLQCRVSFNYRPLQLHEYMVERFGATSSNSSDLETYSNKQRNG